MLDSSRESAVGQDSKIVRLTAIQRALADAIGLANRGDFEKIPASDSALQAMAKELKLLRKKVTILYPATALVAFLILSQASDRVVVDVSDIKLPLSILSNQALAVVLAAAFGYYAAATVSAAMLYNTMAAILKRDVPEGWEFLLARYDADYMWTNMLQEKKLGAPSPPGERAIANAVSVSNIAVVAGHMFLTIGAVAVSFLSAMEAHTFLGLALASLAMVGVLGAAGGAICAVFLKLNYCVPG